MTNIAIFVSGNGTNCENIIKYFSNNDKVNVSIVISNRPDAYALVRAAKYGVPCTVLSKTEINDEATIMPLLQKYDVDFIVLAGFMLMVPEFLTPGPENGRTPASRSCPSAAAASGPAWNRLPAPRRPRESQSNPARRTVWGRRACTPAPAPWLPGPAEYWAESRSYPRIWGSTGVLPDGGPEEDFPFG